MSILMRLLYAEPRSSAGPLLILSVSLLNDLPDPVLDGVALAGFKSWVNAQLLYPFLLSTLFPFSSPSLQAKSLSPSLALLTFSNNNNNNNKKKKKKTIFPNQTPFVPSSCKSWCAYRLHFHVRPCVNLNCASQLLSISGVNFWTFIAPIFRTLRCFTNELLALRDLRNVCSVLRLQVLVLLRVCGPL